MHCNKLLRIAGCRKVTGRTRKDDKEQSHSCLIFRKLSVKTVAFGDFSHLRQETQG
jgi:hypothetical protein